MVIFGASGDLTHRMLLPALYNLALDRRLPRAFAVVGFARTDWSDDEFREEARKSVATVLAAAARPGDLGRLRLGACTTSRGNYRRPGGVRPPQRAAGAAASRSAAPKGNHLFYLAMPPKTSRW